MKRSRAARCGLLVLALILSATGSYATLSQDVEIWTRVPGSNETFESSLLDVRAFGLVLLTMGLVVTTTILVFEAYVLPVRHIPPQEFNKTY